MLTEKIQTDMKAAMKAGDAFRLSALRMAQSALHNKALDKRATLVKAGGSAEDAILSDDEEILVLRSELKRRKDAAGEFDKGHRPELAEKERGEALILEEYLPAEASDEVVSNTVRSAIAEIGSDPKQFGKVMSLAMKTFGGEASGDRVSAEVKKQLGS